MIPETLQQILKQDGVVAIATLGQDGPHLVNTWNSYIRTTDDGRLLIPAGYMHRIEANVAFNPEVLITLGPDYDLLKAKFSWLRATLAVTPDDVTQTW